MYQIIPYVKEKVYLDGKIKISEIKTFFCDPLLLEIASEVQKIFPQITLINDLEKADIIISLEAFAKEEYKIEIDNNKILIKAGFLNGCFYALMTLKQIIAQVDDEVYNLVIHDFPSLAIRGFMMDISRNKVPKLETLKAFVDKMAELKYNHFELYVEGFSFEYRSFKNYLEEEGYITVEEYIELEKYCASRMIDLVPNQNGLGHMTDWLQHDEFKDLAESPDGFFIWGAHRAPSTLNVTDERSIKHVKRMYDDMLPYSNSPYFNMNFDEPYELGEGKSKEYCEKHGKEKAFIDYLNTLYQHVKQYEKTGLIWGDFLLKHPQTLKQLPEDLIFIDWGYHKSYPFDEHLKMLAELKIPFMAAPGTSTWSSITGKIDDMMMTVKNSTTHTKLNHGLGVLMTDWGDMGHLQYLPVSYPGLVYAASGMWGELPATEKEVIAYLDQAIFQDEAQIIGRLLFELGRYDRLEGIYRDYGTKTFSVILWADLTQNESDPLNAFIDKMKSNLIDENHYTKLVEHSDHWEQELAEAQPKCADAELILKEIKYSIRLLRLLWKANRAFDQSLDQDRRETFIDESIKGLAEHRDLHLAAWDARNKHGGFDKSYGRLANLIKVLEKWRQQ